jgi:hypothetical protein
MAFILGLPAAGLALLTILAGEASMGLCCGSFALIMALFGVWPVFRSASFILTNRRLLVTSRFGSTTVIPLTWIDRGRIRVDPLTSSLTLGGERTITLRYIRKCRPLWSLLLLPPPSEAIEAEIVPDEMSAVSSDVPPEPSAESDAGSCVEAGDNDQERSQADSLQPAPAVHEPVEFIWWNAQRLDGLSTQKGFAVLRPSYFLFLPATASKNLALMTAGAFAEVYAAALEIHQIHIEGKVPFEALLNHLTQTDAATFDVEMAKLSEEFDALVWRHGEAVVPRETKYIPFQGRNVVRVGNRAAFVSGGLRAEQVPAFLRLASQWPEVPDLEYRSVPMLIFAAVMLVFFSLFSGCAIFFAVNDPIAIGVVATGLVTLLTLAGWIGWFRALFPRRRTVAAQMGGEDLRKINAPRFEK